MSRLDGQGVQALSKVLSETLSRHDLESYVYSSTGEQLYVSYVAENKPLRPAIADLLVALEQQGSTELFLAKVYAERPLREDVRGTIAALMPEAPQLAQKSKLVVAYQVAGQVQAEAPAYAQASGLQRLVRKGLPAVDIGVWLAKADTVKRQVCKIQYRGAAAGTGFLVGPAAVLTNWHVVQAAVEAGDVASLACTFGYIARDDGTREAGIDVAVREVADHSPYAPAELTATPDQPEPTDDELDYALLLLDVAVGAQEHAGKPARGWLAVRDAVAELAPDATLFIVQHPDGAPMKLALDTSAYIGRFGGGRRLRYRTNTEPGSSGSPCLDLDWQLVALHHYGDPAWQKPLFNQGVPIERIARRLAARGHAALLGR
ncbi:trypsin-like peptidase [Tahibacter aquaticus]|uniref:Trypsin-like peptidase n=1 Tax=Tahibacter aquaticus TaxID=520092 RepID=A0A4R6Z071_9GAMM|nr:serine protease [Tahibacter aquaticus]TDR44905.1 trypsin-like peptidase [Tahibacter aquaticus]